MPRLVAAALALVLAGCSGGDSLHNVRHYRPDPLGYLVTGGTDSPNVATVVTGNPFGISPATLAATVAAGLQGAFPGGKVRFVTEPETDLRRDVALIVVFDPPTYVGPRDVWARGGRVPTGGAGARIAVVMAFCHSASALAGITGKLGRDARLGDQEFVRLIRDMARRMFETPLL